MLPFQQGEPSDLQPSPPTPRASKSSDSKDKAKQGGADDDKAPPPPPPTRPPPKYMGGSGAGKGPSEVITVDDSSSGVPPKATNFLSPPEPPQVPAQVPSAPVADDPLKAASLCGPPPLPNRPKRPVDQMMASSTAGVSGGSSQTQPKKFLHPTSKGVGGAPEVVVPKVASQGNQVNPSSAPSDPKPDPPNVLDTLLNPVQQLG